MSDREPKGKFGVLQGLNDGKTAKQQNVEEVKAEVRYARFSNYLRPDLYDRLQKYVAGRKRSGVKLITAFNEAIEEYLDRRDA